MEKRRPRTTKNIFVYKSGDPLFQGVRVAVNNRRFRSVDALLDELTNKIPGLHFGARKISTPHGKHRIDRIDDIEHMGKLVNFIINFMMVSFISSLCANDYWI